MLSRRCCALLSRLPTTALPVDIKRLENNTVPKNIQFLRTPSLHASGAALTTFADEHDTLRFVKKADRATMGGETITVRPLSASEAQLLVQEHYASFPRGIDAVIQAIAFMPLSSVALRNLPHHTTAEKLDKKLRRSYELVDEAHGRMQSVFKLPPLDLDSTSASFLIRLASASEAMRLVRSWHRTRYMPQKYTVENTGDRYVVEAQLMY